MNIRSAKDMVKMRQHGVLTGGVADDVHGEHTPGSKIRLKVTPAFWVTKGTSAASHLSITRVKHAPKPSPPSEKGASAVGKGPGSKIDPSAPCRLYEDFN